MSWIGCEELLGTRTAARGEVCDIIVREALALAEFPICLQLPVHASLRRRSRHGFTLLVVCGRPIGVSTLRWRLCPQNLYFRTDFGSGSHKQVKCISVTSF